VIKPKISAILLAAGLSRRMGEDKLRLPYKGKPMLQHAVDLISRLPVTEKIIVTTQTRLDYILIPRRVLVITNPHPETGQSGSIRLGLEAATGNWYFFLVADQPGLTTDDLNPLLEYASGNISRIVFPVVGDKPCTPTLFPSEYREELLALSGDMGGRAVCNAHSNACTEVEPVSPKHFFDIDSVADYKALFD